MPNLTPAAERDLTPRQLELLREIAEHQATFGFAPTIRELGDRMGISSTNAVNDMLKSIVLKGCLERVATTARSFTITGKGRLMLGMPSLKSAARLALETLDALATSSVENFPTHVERVGAAREALRKAGVR